MAFEGEWELTLVDMALKFYRKGAKDREGFFMCTPLAFDLQVRWDHLLGHNVCVIVGL